MMTSGEMRGQGKQERFVERQPEEDPRKHPQDDKGPAIDPSMLEAVLDATAVDAREPITEQEMQALRQVARQFQGRPFELDPVAIALVNAILRIRWKRPEASDEFWRAMSFEIATTLYETPQTNERLSRFWKRLCESAS